jgi:hypothetical protein
MSVFHRVDGLDDLPAAQFFPRMVRLPFYDGAVRFALVQDAASPAPAPAAPISQAPPVQAHGRDDFAVLNNTELYGPMGVNQAAVFDLG